MLNESTYDGVVHKMDSIDREISRSRMEEDKFQRYHMTYVVYTRTYKLVDTIRTLDDQELSKRYYMLIQEVLAELEGCHEQVQGIQGGQG